MAEGGDVAGEITLCCAGCGAEFRKLKKEHDRQVREAPGRGFWCSRGCHARSRGRANLGRHLGAGRPENLRADNRRDAGSPFRYFLNKARNRPGETDLDLAFLAELWAAQEGRCALSGIPMTLPETTAAYDRLTGDPWKASLDRVDAERGYVRGNVRFVTLMGNLCRNRFGDEEVRRFAEGVIGMGEEAE